MSIDVSAAYGEGIILTREEYLELEDFLENSNEMYWKYVYRIDCYTDDTEYFFGKILTYAECGYGEPVSHLEIEDPLDFNNIIRGIQEINKRLNTVKSKEKYLLCFLG